MLLGGRSFDEDDWEPVEDQGVIGLEVNVGKTGSFVSGEFGIAYSSEDDDAFDPILGQVDLTAEFLEVYGGVRFSPPTGDIRPYLGVGVSLINADLEVDVPFVGSASDDDTSAAGYIHGGVLFLVGGSFELGLDLRYLFASDLEFGGVSGDADYLQLAFVFGFKF